MTTLEVAIDLIRVYVERGDTYEDLKSSYLGYALGDRRAEIINGAKIRVIRVDHKEACETFDLLKVINIIKQEKNLLMLF